MPHLTNAIQDWIERVAKIPVDETGEEPDVCIVEVSNPFTLERAVGLIGSALTAWRDGRGYRVCTVRRGDATVSVPRWS